MEKILTISIAAYNVEKYIDKTLKSLIIPEIMEKLEVFIVDDGSTDKTLMIAQEYEKKYPNTFHAIHKENGGYGSTVNYSISHATGKYFKLLDGDDWFCSENIVKFIEFLESQDSDIVLSPYQQVLARDNKKIVLDNYNSFEGMKNISEISFEGIVVMHRLCVKTKLIQLQDKKITENCFYTDYEFVFLSLLQACTIVNFNLPIYCYQIGVEGQSVSIEGIRKHYIEKSIVADQMYKWYMEKNPNTFDGFHKTLLIREILGITDDAYAAYMTVLDNKKGKNELMEFDRKINKKFPDIYNMTFSVKKIKLLRKTHFLAFGYLKKKYLKSFL